MELNADNVTGDSASEPVLLENRNHWFVPALIFGGLEFAIPVLMTGATLIASYSFNKVVFIILLAMSLQWVFNALQGYMGAKLGLSCTMIARRSFGVVQSRIVLGLVISFLCIGWGALQIEVAGDALCALMGLSGEKGSVTLAVATTVAGIGFAIPAIGGFTSMKWVDLLAVPAGILLVISALWLSVGQYGTAELMSWSPTPTISISQAISLVIGLNVAQWLIASDYTRHSKPTVRDQLLIPLGILSVGIPLLLVGALMAVGGGEANIVVTMQQLNFPGWGYAILLLALGTSLLVNSYTMGLAIAGAFNSHGNKGRVVTTIIGTVVCIIAAISGVVEYFMDYLYLTGILIPPIVGVMFADFYIMKRQHLSDEIPEFWSPAALAAILCGTGIGYYSQYINPFGIPAVQSLLVSVLVYRVFKRNQLTRHAQV